MKSSADDTVVCEADSWVEGDCLMNMNLAKVIAKLSLIIEKTVYMTFVNYIDLRILIPENSFSKSRATMTKS